MPQSRADAAARLLDAMLLATLALVPMSKLFFVVGGKIQLANVFAATFVCGFVALRVVRRDARVDRPALVLLALVVALVVVDGLAFIGLETQLQRAQFMKAWVMLVLHGSFMVCAAAHLARGGMALVRRAAGWFVAGFVVSAAYAMLQIAALVGAGVDVDRELLGRIPLLTQRGASVIIYGGGLWRPTGLTLDTNHLGVMLVVPIMLGLTWWRGRVRAFIVATCLLGLVLTTSRSGALALLGGIAWIAWHRRRALLSRRVLALTGAGIVAMLVAVQALVMLDPTLARALLFARLDPSGHGAQTHLQLYGTVPELLALHPLTGIGLNGFALHFADMSGRLEFGPHSAYIKLVAETGIIGTALFVMTMGTVLGWLSQLASRGRTPVLALGLGAAIFGTLCGNIFYLTTHFMYDEVLLAFASALVAVLAGTGQDRGARAGDHASASR